jgi:cyclopropane fatty-acyl-phospholipid synthase-like methyltransferase
MSSCAKFKHVIDGQKQHWNKMYAEDANFFGEEPSYAAKKAAEIFKKQGKLRILELGAGQGRDSLFFAKSGLKVQAVDYSDNAVQAINQKANSIGLTDSVSAIQHDIRKPLPFANECFDGCYCHMLYCMALCTTSLKLFSRGRGC